MGDAAILPSYTAERRPIGARVVAEANKQYGLPPQRFLRPGLDDPGPAGCAARAAAHAQIMAEKATEFFSRGLVLGQTYASAIISAEPAPPVNQEVGLYVPTAQPGARLPHVRRGDVSVYDLLARDQLTLISLAGAYGGAAAIQADAATSGVPLTLLMLDPALRRNLQASYLVIRPDGHVAWRGEHSPGPEACAKWAGRPSRLVQPA